MKKFYLFFLFLNAFPCLVQAVGLNDVPEDPKINIIGFSDQKSWDALWQVNSEFRALIPQTITAIKVRGYAEDIINKLTALFFEGDAQGKKNEILESLDLSAPVGSRLGLSASRQSKLGDDGLGTVVDFIQKHFPNIKSLNLLNNNIGPSGAAHLARLNQLETLDLNNNQIGPAGASHLAGLDKLQVLNLLSNEIGDTGAAHLAGLTQLKILDLGWNDIGDAGVAHFTGLHKLQVLNLYFNNIKTAGAVQLARLCQLKELNLSDNRIGDVGAAEIAKLTQLKELVIRRINISDAGVVHFFELNQLQKLCLNANNIGSQSIDALRQALPNCVIEF